MIEEWRQVADMPAYEVSNLGRVRSIDRLIPNGHGGFTKCPGRLLTPRPQMHGYPVVTLRNGKSVSVVARVHRLVAIAFVPNPFGKETVNHIDCNRANAVATNLEWCTQKENLMHSQNLGRMQRNYWSGRRSPSASLTDATARSIRDAYAQGGVSYAALAKRYGTNKRTVGRIISGETYV
jgi:hypothetical protein